MPTGVYNHRPLSEEAKKRLSEFWTGKAKSSSHAENIRLSKIGEKNPMWGKSPSEETRQKMRDAMTGRVFSDAHRAKLKECVRRGEQSNFWLGGVCEENNRIRHSTEYREWRSAIFRRDDYTCQECGIRGARLNADHIKPFALFKDLRFDIENGRTLCEPCHKETETYGRWTPNPSTLKPSEHPLETSTQE
jgi:hypothetical protein